MTLKVYLPAFKPETEITSPSTLTTAWFAFWGTELVALAAIKTTKVKHQKEEIIEEDIISEEETCE